MKGLSIIIPIYKEKENFENLIKKIYLNSKKKLFAKGYKILSDLIYSSHYNLKIYDKKIIFKSRTQNVSKLGIKILLYIIQFIIIRFFASLFMFKKGR